MTKEQIKTVLSGGDVDEVRTNSGNSYGLQNSKYRKWSKGVVPYDITGISK